MIDMSMGKKDPVSYTHLDVYKRQGLQIDDGPRDLVHALRHAADLAARGSAASMMTLSAFVSAAREKTS